MKIVLDYPFKLKRKRALCLSYTNPLGRHNSQAGLHERTLIVRGFLAGCQRTWEAPHEPGDFVVEHVTVEDDEWETWHLGS